MAVKPPVKKTAAKKTTAKSRSLKIPITTIDKACTTQTGLHGEGCYGCSCDDDCCQWGCDVDLATLKLIFKNRKLIEPLIKAKLEDCFKTELKVDDDYAGGSYRETGVRAKDTRCFFHLHEPRGCSLFYLWAKKGLPKRIVPTICRVYPLTWHRGRLFVDTPIRQLCKANEKTAKGVKAPSLLDTQMKELKLLFNIKK